MDELASAALQILETDITRNSNMCNKYNVMPTSIYWICTEFETEAEWKNRQVNNIVSQGYWQGMMLFDPSHHCTYSISLSEPSSATVVFNSNGLQSEILVDTKNISQVIDEWHQNKFIKWP
jgi:hypothetical protein